MLEFLTAHGMVILAIAALGQLGISFLQFIAIIFGIRAMNFSNSTRQESTHAFMYAMKTQGAALERQGKVLEELLRRTEPK